ncbi:gliding motility-associated C-terminal domain-containing protein, partial [Bizionia gelidisalsuginis]
AAEPITECWETATFNNDTCIWEVTGEQSAAPATECWETATFNNDTCSWVVTGTQEAAPTIGNQTDLCIDNDFDFDLFSLLGGDFQTDGSWSVTSGNATINGSMFNPFELELGVHTFTYFQNTTECPRNTEVTITLNDDCIVLGCGDEVIISKAVTANGDQWNEYFTVEGIEDCGFTVDIKIFNRWGAKIYESRDYKNNWNGFTHSNSVGGADKVPTGTYYYIVNLKGSGLKPLVGPIYLGTK